MRTTHGRTYELPIKVGLHQGSGLSPFLFIVVLDVISEEFRCGLLCELLFANDMAVVTYTEEQMQSFIRTCVFKFAIFPVVVVVVVAPGVFRVAWVATIVLCFSTTTIGEDVFAILLRPWYTLADRWVEYGIMCRVRLFSHVVPAFRIIVVIFNACNKNNTIITCTNLGYPNFT